MFATPLESHPFIHSGPLVTGELPKMQMGGKDITIVYTGIGIMSTAYELGRMFMNRRFDLAVNAGICGAYDKSLVPGTVVNVESDCFADLGAEDDHQLLNVFDIGLKPLNEFPFMDGKIQADRHPATHSLKNVRAITVNKTSGSETTIEILSKKYAPDIESMEGAAFLYACKMNDIPCIQVRAVSNYVEKRNKENWQTDLALDKLSSSLKSILEVL